MGKKTTALQMQSGLKQSADIEHSTKPPTKKETALTNFLQGSMNSIDANRQYHDTCLHTTVSGLVRDHGIEFLRTPERVKNHAGTYSVFTRYRLHPDDVVKALEIVQRLRKARGCHSGGEA
jgi:hypothetical protein